MDPLIKTLCASGRGWKKPREETMLAGALPWLEELNRARGQQWILASTLRQRTLTIYVLGPMAISDAVVHGWEAWEGVRVKLSKLYYAALKFAMNKWFPTDEIVHRNTSTPELPLQTTYACMWSLRWIIVFFRNQTGDALEGRNSKFSKFS